MYYCDTVIMALELIFEHTQRDRVALCIESSIVHAHGKAAAFSSSYCRRASVTSLAAGH